MTIMTILANPVLLVNNQAAGSRESGRARVGARQVIDDSNECRNRFRNREAGTEKLLPVASSQLPV
jgi:hypothetical protein